MQDGEEHSIGGENMSTRNTSELLSALGSAFSATLLGVAVRDLDVMPVLGDRLLAELRKRGFAVLPQPQEASESGS